MIRFARFQALTVVVHDYQGGGREWNCAAASPRTPKGPLPESLYNPYGETRDYPLRCSYSIVTDELYTITYKYTIITSVSACLSRKEA